MTAPAAPDLKKLEDLQEKTVYVRESSSFFEHIQMINDSLSGAGKPAIRVHKVDENLGNEDILEIVNTGIYPVTIVDEYIGDLWAQVFDSITVLKYLRFIIDRHFSGETVDSLNAGLFSVASYNAGPARIQDLRGKAANAGLDPNVWFDNVEMVAAREIGREAVQYVSNIYKYYVSYRYLNQYMKETGKTLEE